MQCACTILSSIACPALQYFSTLSHKRHDFRKKLWNIKCVFWISLQIMPETFFILGRIRRVTIVKIHSFSCKAPVILSRIWRNLKFVDRFLRNIQRSNLMNIRSMGPKLVHADRRAGRQTHRRNDMTKLIAAFRNFADAPKKWNMDSKKRVKFRIGALQHCSPRLIVL
jgi:hypothetical protein